MKKDHKISGFKTPPEYFENFEEQIFGRIEEEKFSKSTGFKVPEAYFDNLEERIIEKEIPSQKHRKVIPLFPKKYFGYAAAIAASLIVGVSFFNSNQNKSTLDTIQIGLIDKYIEDGNLNMDLYDLTTYLESSESPIVDFENHFISQTDLKDYLLENTEEEFLLDNQ